MPERQPLRIEVEQSEEPADVAAFAAAYARALIALAHQQEVPRGSVAA